MLSLDSLTNTVVLNDVIGNFDIKIHALRSRKHNNRSSLPQQEPCQPPPLKKQNLSMPDLLSTKELRKEIKRREKRYIAAKAKAESLMGKHHLSTSSEVEAMARKLKCPYPFDIVTDPSRHEHLSASYYDTWYRKSVNRRKEYLCYCRREELYRDIFGDNKANMTESDIKTRQELLSTWAKTTISASILSHKMHELRDARRKVAYGLANLCCESLLDKLSKKALAAAPLLTSSTPSSSPFVINTNGSNVDMCGNLTGSGSGGTTGTNKMDKLKQLNTIVHTIISTSCVAQSLPTEAPTIEEIPEIPNQISSDISEWHMNGLRILINSFFVGNTKCITTKNGEPKAVCSPQKCWIADSVELKPRAMVGLFLRYLALTGTSWGTHLIVCEMGTMQSWKTVMAEYAPELLVMPYWGTARQRNFCRALWDAKTPRSIDSPVHVLLMPFQVLAQDKESFSSPIFSICVIDDAYSFLSRGIPRRCGGLLSNGCDGSNSNNNNGAICSIVNNNINSNWNNSINGVPGPVLLERWNVLDDLERKIDILLGDESYVVDNPAGAIGCLEFFGCVRKGSLHGRAATWFTKESESPFPSSVRLRADDAATVLRLLGPGTIKQSVSDFPQSFATVITESKTISCALKPLQATAYEIVKSLPETSTNSTAFKIALLHSLMSANFKLILGQHKMIRYQYHHHHQQQQQQLQQNSQQSQKLFVGAKCEPETSAIGVTSLIGVIDDKKGQPSGNDSCSDDEWSTFWETLAELTKKAAEMPQEEGFFTSPDDPGKLEALARLLIHDLEVGKPESARPIICVAGADGALSVEGTLEKLGIGYVSADTVSPIACRDATEKFLCEVEEYSAFVLQVPDAEFMWNGSIGGAGEKEAVWAWRNDVDNGLSDSVILYDAHWITQSTVDQVVSLAKGLREQKRPINIYKIYTENTCECDFQIDKLKTKL